MFTKKTCLYLALAQLYLKSGGDQWRRQDLVSGGHDDRGAEGASTDAKGAEWGRVWGGVSPPQPTRGPGERRELPQRRYRIFCMF